MTKDRYLMVMLCAAAMAFALVALGDRWRSVDDKAPDHLPRPVVTELPRAIVVAEEEDEDGDIVIESRLAIAPASFVRTVWTMVRRGESRGFPFDEFVPSDRELLLDLARLDTRERAIAASADIVADLCAMPKDDGLRRGLLFAAIADAESTAHDAAVSEMLVELTSEGAKRLAGLVVEKDSRPTTTGVDWEMLAFAVPAFTAAATNQFCDEKDY